MLSKRIEIWSSWHAILEKKYVCHPDTEQFRVLWWCSWAVRCKIGTMQLHVKGHTPPQLPLATYHVPAPVQLYALYRVAAQWILKSLHNIFHSWYMYTGLCILIYAHAWCEHKAVHILCINNIFWKLTMILYVLRTYGHHHMCRI